MKIVEIEDFFHPDAGYQINVLSEYLSKMGNQVVIVTSELEKMPAFLTNFFGADNISERDRSYEKRTGVKIIRQPIFRYISGRSIYYPSIFRVVDELAPDILYVHGNDTYIGMKYAARIERLKYPVIFDNHMLDMASKNKFRSIFRCYYRTFITPKLKKNKSIIIRTVNDDFIFKRYSISKEQSPVIGFGSNLLLFHPDSENKSKMREKLKIGSNSIVFIYAGKLDESKGGGFFAQSISEKFNSDKEAVFLIIGNFVGDYGKNVQRTLKQSKNRMIHLPSQKYIDLAQYYQCADFAVFPRQCSLSFYDVQACGLPVVLEDNVVNRQRVTHKNGILFHSMDQSDLRDKIFQCAQINRDLYHEMSKNSIELIKTRYNYETVAKDYLRIINSEMEKYKEEENAR